MALKRLCRIRNPRIARMVGEVAETDGTLVSSWVLRPENNLGQSRAPGNFNKH